MVDLDFCVTSAYIEQEGGISSFSLTFFQFPDLIIDRGRVVTGPVAADS